MSLCEYLDEGAHLGTYREVGNVTVGLYTLLQHDQLRLLMCGSYTHK